MKWSKVGKRTPKANAPPPVAKLKGRPSGIPNPKVGAQARKLLGKHYASKYQTMRRG